MPTVTCAGCGETIDVSGSENTPDLQGTTYCETEVGKFVNQCIPDSALSSDLVDKRNDEGGKKPPVS